MRLYVAPMYGYKSLQVARPHRAHEGRRSRATGKSAATTSTAGSAARTDGTTMPPERRMTIAEERPRSGASRPPKPSRRSCASTASSAPLHWVNATLFGILMLTGAALYAGPISHARRQPRGRAHGARVQRAARSRSRCSSRVLGRRGTRLRTDLGRLNRWSHDDARWFRRRHRDQRARSASSTPARSSTPRSSPAPPS